MSWTGQCHECGLEALIDNMTGISTLSGPAFYRWRDAMRATFQVSPDEDLQKAS